MLSTNILYKTFCSVQKLFVILFILSFSPFILFSQSCLPEGITFTTQAQIDSFQINYPNCTEIEGDVQIEGDENTDITNLESLNVITFMYQDLRIENNPTLFNLLGLHNIHSIGGSLVIAGNNELGNCVGLNDLTNIGGDFEIKENPAMTNLSGLDSLNTIGGSLQIYGNDNLNNVNGLETLSFVSGDLVIGSGIMLYGGNPFLSDISGLNSLTSIGGMIKVSNNDSLTSLTGLGNIAPESIYGIQIDSNQILSTCGVESICTYLANPYGSVIIEGNAPGCNEPEQVIESCDGICLPAGIIFSNQEQIDAFQSNHPNCSEIAGNVIISGEDISNLNGLNILTSVWGNLLIGGNPMLCSLSGLDSLSYIGGSFLIVENDTLVDVVNLNGLQYIGSNFKISENKDLISLSGLDGVDYIGGNIRIIDNANLESLAQFSNIEYVYGDLEIIENSILLSLDDFSNLLAIVGDLHIRSNEQLESLTGLENLTSVGGKLEIKDNVSLPDFQGLNNLISTNGLEILNNDALTDLTGLESLAYLFGGVIIQDNDGLTGMTEVELINPGSIENLVIQNNVQLSACEAQWICDYLNIPNSLAQISDNSPGCNSVEEVLEACWTIIDKYDLINGFTISPNPSSSNLKIRFTIFERGITTFELFEISGVKVKSLINEIKMPGTYEKEVDLSKLNPGIYFCVLKTEEGIQTKKLIKF